MGQPSQGVIDVNDEARHTSCLEAHLCRRCLHKWRGPNRNGARRLAYDRRGREAPQGSSGWTLARAARASELWALRRREVDVMRGRITVERSVKEWRDGVPAFGTTKTGKVRTVELAELLAAHLASPADTPSPDALVFTLKHGGPIRHEPWYRAYYRPAVRQVLAEHRDRRFRTLRHSYATMLLSAGVNPAWVAKQGGWASTKILLDTYGRALPEDDDCGRGVLSGAFQSGTAPNVVTFQAGEGNAAA